MADVLKDRLQKWQQYTSTEEYQKAPDEDKKLARDFWVQKSTEKTQLPQVLFNVVSGDLKTDVYNDEEFASLPENDQKELIRLNLQLRGESMEPKRGMRILGMPLVPDRDPVEAAYSDYQKYILGRVASLPIEGVKQTAADIVGGVVESYGGEGGAKFADTMRETASKEATKTKALMKGSKPLGSIFGYKINSADVVETGTQVTIGVAQEAAAKGLKLPLKIVSTAATDYAITPELEGQKGAKETAGLVAGGADAGMRALPPVIGSAGKVIGNLRGYVSNKARMGDAADALIDATKTSGIANSPEYARQQLGEALTALRKAEESGQAVFTGALEPSGSLASAQLQSVPNRELLVEQAFGVPAEAAAGQLGKLTPAGNIGDKIGSTRAHVISKYADPQKKAEILKKQAELDQVNTDVDTAIQSVFDKARASGALTAKTDITEKELGQYLQRYLKSMPEGSVEKGIFMEDKLVKGYLKIAEDTNKNAGKRVLDVENLTNLKASILTNKDQYTHPIAERIVASIDKMTGNVDAPIMKQVKELEKQRQASKVLLNSTLDAALNKFKADKKIVQNFVADSPKVGSIVKGLSDDVPSAEMQLITKDPQIKSSVKAAALIDMQDVLGTGVADRVPGSLDLAAWRKKYINNPSMKNNILTLFNDDEAFKQAFSELDVLSKQGERLTTAARKAVPQETTSSIRRAIRGVFGETINVRTQTTQGLEEIQRIPQDKISELLAQSATDPKLARQIVERAVSKMDKREAHKAAWEIINSGNAAIGLSLGGNVMKPSATPQLPDQTEGFSAPETVIEPMNYETTIAEDGDLSMLIENEGLETSVYEDTEGVKTVGIGFNMETSNARRVWQKAGMTADFDAVLNDEAEITEAEARQLAKASKEIATEDARKTFRTFDKQPPIVQEALIDMSYQLGGPRLRGFKNLRKALDARDYNRAAKEVLNSRYAEQTPNRAQRTAEKIKQGLTQG